MTYRIPPGPVGTSCLTCKRRHKKCDRTKPICNRCSKGGYECLGYEHNLNKHTGSDDESLPSDPTRVISVPSYSPASSSSAYSADGPRDDEPLISHAYDTLAPGNYDLRSHLVSSDTIHPPQQLSSLSTHSGVDATVYGDPPPTTPEVYIAQTGARLSRSLHNTDNAVAPQPVLSSDPLLLALASQIPQSVPLPPEIRGTVEYVISRVDRILNVTYFRPQGEQIARFLGQAALRLAVCDFARQGMLVYAKIRESILEGSDSGNRSNFARWIDGYEQALSSSFQRSLTPYEHRERHNDVLEVFYVKVAVLDAAATYRLMCRLVPNFLQAVYSDPALWSTEHNPAFISIAHLFSSSRYGPAFYMCMDVMASMAYGVPHLVEYSTDTEPFHTEPHTTEWMNCVPGEFLILLAKINICRDQGLLAEDWQDIERRLVTWEPRLRFKPQGLDSNRSVAWLALQESWRQTLLIYLYLALCGARTDDLRIQFSLRQIFQIVKTIKRQDSPIGNIHFFVPYLIAGICSRTEKQRRLVRERLGCATESRFWLFHGPDIIPVLDHLWLGAAIGGQPITWDDYIRSRHVMLPLSS
ncbi:unnamed protein product [Rhizoctonia solani]|uniref:Zn(2)-C6 fungal-type domain-containing protein n=1 Tax=Rhizoctonia solani TaxID=456999 RepID=A0A8H3E0D1_9AGAM|nr:unnamed protein product [Rhizoctonia solani]